MARDFAKTSGSDYLNWPTGGVLSAALHGASKLSWVTWVYFDTLTTTTTSDNVIFRMAIKGGSLPGSSGLFINVCNDALQNVVKVGSRSITTDAVQTILTTTTLSALVPIALGVEIDFAADALAIYFNGVPQSLSGSPVYGASTYTDNNDQSSADGLSSNGASTTHHLDGRLWDMGLWKDGIGADGFRAHAQGAIPATILPASLVSDVKLSDNGSLLDTKTGETLTVTGSVPIIAAPPNAPRGPKRIVLAQAMPRAARW